MAENNFNVSLAEGKNGEVFVAEHFLEITGIEIPAEAKAKLLMQPGYNAGNDVFLVWYTNTSGKREIMDGVKVETVNGVEQKEAVFRTVSSQSILTQFLYAVEVKADCGKFLSRNNTHPDSKIVLNASCGSLGFEVYKEKSHKPGWLWQYMEELRLDGTGLSFRGPQMLIHTLYLSGAARGVPFACVAIPWNIKTIEYLKRYISREKSWVIEEDVAAGTVTINPLCGSTYSDGLAWQGSSKGEGFNMIHIPMTNILKHMDGKIIMVGKPLTDTELFTTDGFKGCVEYFGNRNPLKAEKLVKERYRFLQDHATGQINL